MYKSASFHHRSISRARFLFAIPIALLALGIMLQQAFFTRPVQAVSTGVVISQVYGGGGNSGATLTNDFIELFNRGNSAVSLSGWSVQYASSAGTTWTVTALTSVTLQPGQYYLIQEATGAGGTTPLPAPDAIGTTAMSATNAKVALVNTTAALAGACPVSASIVDLVGYGTANCFEGAAVAALTNTTAASRNTNGCTETDNNAADFTVTAPAPRNTNDDFGICGGPSNPSGVGAANPNSLPPGNSTLLTVNVTPGTSPASTGITVTGNLTNIGGAASQTFFDNATNGDVTAADNIFSFQATVAGGTTGGPKTLPISIADAEARGGSTNISLTVQANSNPSVTGAANPSTAAQGASVVLTGTVTPGLVPNSTGITVTGDLSAIGGSATQQFFDDGVTGGDTVAGNNVFTFTITINPATTTGAKSLPLGVADAQARSGSGAISLTVITPPAPHDPAEHMVMGNPNGATADVNFPDNYLMMKLQYALSYNNTRRIPNWTSWHLDSTWRGSAARQDDFRFDPDLPAGFNQVQSTDYSGSGFDRGHMDPSADRTSSIPDNSATFLMTNMIPQAPGNNQGPWAAMENYLRTFLPGSELYIVSGGTGVGGTGSGGGTTNVLPSGVTVPQKTWKVVVILPVGDNDLSRVDASTRTLAVIMPNIDSIRSDQWQKYLATIDQVESLTGYDLFNNVLPATQSAIEAVPDAGNDTAPVTAGQGPLSTPENQNLAVTLSATDLNVNNVFTYTIVTPPMHGSVNGSGANRTYSPAMNYVGPDSFTFKANDGALDSNTSTVTISVTAAPTAAPAGISGQIVDGAGQPVSGATVTVTGESRLIRTITSRSGSYRVENLDAGGFYVVRPAKANYAFTPESRSFSLVGARTDAVFTAAAVDPDANPLESPEFFVRQQYVDFLGREPDQEGLDYWSGQLRACGADLRCVSDRRIALSAAFFVEQEFQDSGLFIYDLYQGALGRRPAHSEYADDRTRVVGGATLETDKVAFAASFVARAEFIGQYPLAMTEGTFVDALLQRAQETSGVDLGDQRASLIALYRAGANTSESRSAVVRSVVEGSAFKQSQYNSAFVLMEYFSYLGRDPEAGGYDFWLNVLNTGARNNYRGMVCSFITSAEYQRRFSPVVSYSNTECGR